MASEIQKIELEMLIFLDKVCKKNNIEYFLDSGTLIGAARHKGFIPWDDDVDIILKREDYNKLLIALKKEEDRYVCHTIDEPNYVFPYAKLIDTTTELHEKNVKDDIKFGVYIDIFVLDKLPTFKITQLIYFNIVAFLRWSSVVLSKKEYSKNFFKASFKRILEILPSNTFPRLTNASAALFGQKKHFEYYTGILCTAKKYKYIERKWFDKAIYVDFENISLPVPVQYDAYLRMLYGDYMKMPDQESRATHQIKVEL